MAIDYFQPDTLAQSNPVLSGFQNAQTLQGQLGLLKAQSGLANAQTQYFPLTAQGQYYAGLGRYLQGSYNWSPQHQIAAYQNDPGYQALLANNPQLARMVANIQANSSTGNGSGMSGAPGPGLPGIMPLQGSNQSSPTSTPPSTQTASGDIPLTPQQLQTYNSVRQGIQNGQQQGASSLNDYGSPNQQNGSLINQSDVDAFSDAMGSRSIKNTNTNQVLNQRQYSQILEPLLAQGQQLMPSVAKYSGLKGRVELGYDASKAALGMNSPDYTNYRIFTSTVAPNVANELRRVLGGQATDSERDVMDQLAHPAYWHSNPSLAMAQYQSLVDLYQKSVNPALAKSPAQVQQNLQQGGNQYSNASLTPPTFNSRNDFSNWYKSLTPQQKNQYKSQLGNQGGAQ